MSAEILEPRPSTLDEEQFVATYGDVYEHSPWVAREAYRRGLDARADEAGALAEAMGRVLAEADAASQLEVIRAHPDLAGKAAVSGELTDDSTKEQAGAGLDQCTPEEFERFQRLNEAYWQKFDMPFVMAVKGFDRHQILDAFERRVDNDPAEERRTAIEQINRIARLRLEGRAG
ncbi:2-oxo-4-hydroxy-4-carboxy-5-ureidoimidazoline decarboxylase [Arhodomonas sp. AD133]|uniref:2-oxo-4-hydroxy-4-carboxy-5-ureidoimidazoline decarboxylase n=1 Tax=Arhodomonas sp. AD133 TaxID=3415009 RepID=UPI003EBE121B